MHQKILAFQQSQLKKNPPLIRPGDTVKVYQEITEGNKKRIQVFEGIVIAQKHGYGFQGSFTVRKISPGGVGVERIFMIHSPTLIKVERLKTARVRRAKLYYLRHGRGSTMKLKGEKVAKMIWEEPEAEKELEEIHKKQEAEARQRELERQREEQELEKKFEAVKGVAKAADGQSSTNSSENKEQSDQ